MTFDEFFNWLSSGEYKETILLSRNPDKFFILIVETFNLTMIRYSFIDGNNISSHHDELEIFHTSFIKQDGLFKTEIV